jgi:hypothetical protein
MVTRVRETGEQVCGKGIQADGSRQQWKVLGGDEMVEWISKLLTVPR